MQVRRALAARNNNSPVRQALVLGAGGTARAACYALAKLQPTELYVYNRSKDKAAALAEAFGATVCNDLGGWGSKGLKELDVVVSCVPGAAGVTLTASQAKPGPTRDGGVVRQRVVPVL